MTAHFQLCRMGYSALYGPLAPVLLGYWLTREDSRSRLREYMTLGEGPDRERCGPGAAPRLCLHAVSVGELVSALPVLDALDARGPLDWVLSTTIADAITMADRSGRSFSDRRFMPVDLLPMQLRRLRMWQPRATLISETDFWPNMLEAHHREEVPVYLVNGRISSKMHQGFSRVLRFSRELFCRLRRAFVQTAQDQDRLVDLGLPAERVVVAGNTKYEAALRAPPPDPEPESVVERLRDPCAGCLVAGSTHPGEEEPVLALARRSRIVVIAPRNPRRAREIVGMAAGHSLVATTLGAWLSEALPGKFQVMVIDRIGLLPRLYDLGPVAFIGGSFDGSGGHNFLEAARAGAAIVTGPAMRNFHEDVGSFTSRRALVQAPSLHELPEVLERVFADEGEARAMGARARALLEENRGAAGSIAGSIAGDLGLTRVAAGGGKP